MENTRNNTGPRTFLTAVVFGLCLLVSSISCVSSRYVLSDVVLPGGLTAYYPFNGNANDESGNGHNGRIYGAMLAPDRFGNPESAYSFNGKSDYIHTAFAADQFAGDFTLSAWVKFNNFDNSFPQILCGDHYFLILHGMGPAYQYLNQKGHLAFYQQTSMDHERSERIGLLVSAQPLHIGNWHLITIMKKGLHFSLLVDGVLQAENIADHGIPLTGTSLYIGANIPGGGQPSGYLDGLIDDIRIYNRALSDQEIQLLFNEKGGKTGRSGTEWMDK